MQNRNESKPLAIGLTVLSALGRLLPHAPNVTPLGGSCLFAGSRISGGMAYLLPLIAMVITDPFLSHGLSRIESPASFLASYSLGSLVIYAAFLINVWIGRRMVNRVTPIRVGASAFLCSLQFFALTNLSVWLRAATGVKHMYALSPAGLAECYLAALPFWGRTLAGDLVFSAAIFGAYELAMRHAVRPTEAAA